MNITNPGDTIICSFHQINVHQLQTLKSQKGFEFIYCLFHLSLTWGSKLHWKKNHSKFFLLHTCWVISSPAFRTKSSSDSSTGKSISSKANNLETFISRTAKSLNAVWSLSCRGFAKSLLITKNWTNPIHLQTNKVLLQNSTHASTTSEQGCKLCTSLKCWKSHERSRISSGGKSRVPRGGSTLMSDVRVVESIWIPSFAVVTCPPTIPLACLFLLRTRISTDRMKNLNTKILQQGKSEWWQTQQIGLILYYKKWSL